MSKELKDYVAFVVPTGVGASIGGYAGDASPYAKKFAKHFHTIVNPNVVNAACFSGITENMLYVEGSALDEFIRGDIGLIPSSHNKIGVIFDKAIPENILNIHINTINAMKMVYGFDILSHEITSEEAGVNFFKTSSGISSGEVLNPDTLVESGKRLLKKGAEVLAVVCLFDADEENGEDYASGNAVDVIGGIEGVISHYLTKKLNVPCVHAPAFLDIEIADKIVCPKSASEYVTTTFLPCLFFGLENAPLLDIGCKKESSIKFNQLKALVMPYNSLGSAGVLSAIENSIPVIAVRENKTVLNITAKSLNIENKVVEVETYDDALNYLLKGENYVD